MAKNSHGVEIVCPIKFKLDKVEFQPDIEPQIRVRGGNIIARNTIAKKRDLGTVKEIWSSDDYEIEIKGIIMSSNSDKFPSEEFNNLRFFAEAHKAISVECPILTEYAIDKIVIHTYEFPDTPGMGNQEYIIHAWSDNDFEIF